MGQCKDLFLPRGTCRSLALPAEGGARAAHTFPGVLEAPGTLIKCHSKTN